RSPHHRRTGHGGEGDRRTARTRTRRGGGPGGWWWPARGHAGLAAGAASRGGGGGSRTTRRDEYGVGAAARWTRPTGDDRPVHRRRGRTHGEIGIAHCRTPVK